MDNMENTDKNDAAVSAGDTCDGNKAGGKSKKTAAVLIAVMVVLIAAAVVLVKINSADMSSDASILTVTAASQEQAVFELSDIEAMEYVDIKKNIKSGSGPDEEGTFRCVNIKDILAAAGVTLTGNENGVTVRSADGYTTAFDIDEVMADNCILLAYQKNGELLGDKSSGGNGPFRMIAADDPFGMRCSKYVNGIEVE